MTPFRHPNADPNSTLWSPCGFTKGVGNQQVSDKLGPDYWEGVPQWAGLLRVTGWELVVD